MDTRGAAGLTGLRNPGMFPKIISRTSGKPIPQMMPTRSRMNRVSSVSVRRRRAAVRGRGAAGSAAVSADIALLLGAGSSLVVMPAGQRNERVLQAGLVTPQLASHDAAPGQQRGDRVEHGARA